MPANYIYRHTTVARFQITGNVGEAPFDFKNHLLRIDDEKRNNRFLDLVEQMHPRDRAQIKEINSEAAANLERSIGPRVSREALDTGMIRSGVKGPDGSQLMTQTQIDELAEQQRLTDENAKALEQQALDEAARLVKSGQAAEQAEKERLARVEAAEKEAAAAGKIDQTENKESEQKPTEQEKPKAAAPAGVGLIKK